MGRDDDDFREYQEWKRRQERDGKHENYRKDDRGGRGSSSAGTCYDFEKKGYCVKAKEGWCKFNHMKDGRSYTIAFPLKVGKQGCLNCHSTPEAAPPAMVDLYGPDHGFGWKLGETIGAQIISAPMSLIDDRAKETVGVLIAAVSAAFLLVLIVTNLLLTRIVVGPVRRMSDVAEKVSMGDFDTPEYAKPGTDEISSLSASFNRMRRSLESAMRMIDD